MKFYIDDDSVIPVFEQLREQVLSAIASGSIVRDEQLPSVRDVAAQLGVNPNTVNRAYAQLERDGVLETRRGRGTFVKRAQQRETDRYRLREIARRYVAHARSLGYARTHILRAIRDELGGSVR